MLFLSLFSVFYFLLVTCGVLAALVLALRKLPFLSKLETWPLVLLAGGVFPALVSICGYLGIARVFLLPELCAAGAALFALWLAFKKRNSIAHFCKKLLTWSNMPYVTVAILFSAIFVVAQGCYLEGGINNLDQFRGLGFTSAFAANDLKPAHPLDLSLPVSYGYYFYEYTAFLYSAVNGQGWPSAALFIGAMFCIAAFYFSFLQFAKKLIPGFTPALGFLAVLAVTFYGLDFLSPNSYHGDWWNTYQITQMASYWSWLYHYLLGAAFALAALVWLHEALMQQSSEKFFVSILFLLLAPLYATITGIFFGGVYALIFLLAALRDRKTVSLLYFGGKSAQAFSLLVFSAIILCAPQIFTFWGRGSYLSLHEPVLWFTQKPVSQASWLDWQQSFGLLGAELGPLHFLAFFLTPVCIYSLYKQRPAAGLIIFSLFVAIIFSLSFVQAPTLDWYWRAGNFGLIILTALTAVWTMSYIPYERNLKSVAILSLVLALLAPGAWNFYVENMKRYNNCFAAPKAAMDINRGIGLHMAIGYTPEERTPPGKPILPEPGHPWSHAYFRDKESKVTLNSEQDVALAMAHQAGRVTITKKNPLWAFLDVYAAPAPFLLKYFSWKEAAVCGKSWYGSSIPRKDYVKIISLESFKTETVTCAP